MIKKPTRVGQRIEIEIGRYIYCAVAKLQNNLFFSSFVEFFDFFFFLQVYILIDMFDFLLCIIITRL